MLLFHTRALYYMLFDFDTRAWTCVDLRWIRRAPRARSAPPPSFVMRARMTQAKYRKISWAFWVGRWRSLTSQCKLGGDQI